MINYFRDLPTAQNFSFQNILFTMFFIVKCYFNVVKFNVFSLNIHQTSEPLNSFDFSNTGIVMMIVVNFNECGMNAKNMIRKQRITRTMSFYFNLSQTTGATQINYRLETVFQKSALINFFYDSLLTDTTERKISYGALHSFHLLYQLLKNFIKRRENI